MARLVEREPRNVEIAQAAVRKADLTEISAMVADAGLTDSYDGAVPADLVLACGVFGNISDQDILRTIGSLPQLCASDATVIWTRHRQAPDLTSDIRHWFNEAGFTELAFDAPSDSFFTVGTHRLQVSPEPLQPGTRLFSFADNDTG